MRAFLPLAWLSHPYSCITNEMLICVGKCLVVEGPFVYVRPFMLCHLSRRKHENLYRHPGLELPGTTFKSFFHHRITLRPLAKNGLGISSLSGSQTGGGVLSLETRSAMRAAKARPFGSGLRVPSASSTGLPPALACASSTNVLPRGAIPPAPTLLTFTILFFTATLLKSSPEVVFLCFKLLLRVGETGVFSWPWRFVELGIFDSLLFGELLRSFSAVPLDCGLRSGALDNVCNEGAASLKMFAWLALGRSKSVV